MQAVDELFKIQEIGLIEFTKSLIPGLKEEVIGCRTPEIKNLVRKLIKCNEYESFLKTLPHKYHEENLLHGFILARIKVSQKELFDLVNEFLPYVNNWSVCDSMVKRSKVFTSDLDKLFIEVKNWLNSKEVYHIRFGIITMMSYFLNDEYIDEVISLASSIQTDEYYINMALSWLYATALINYYDLIIKLLVERKLNIFVHNKTIQKANESYRINESIKEYLKTLKIKKKG
jgi:3-methyladenine DNA glycosylase AlkD